MITSGKNGRSPGDFKKFAEKRIFPEKKTQAEVKAGELVKWLKEDFQFGHGHAMAIYALLKGMKKESE